MFSLRSVSCSRIHCFRRRGENCCALKQNSRAVSETPGHSAAASINHGTPAASSNSRASLTAPGPAAIAVVAAPAQPPQPSYKQRLGAAAASVTKPAQPTSTQPISPAALAPASTSLTTGAASAATQPPKVPPPSANGKRTTAAASQSRADLAPAPLHREQSEQPTIKPLAGASPTGTCGVLNSNADDLLARLIIYHVMYLTVTFDGCWTLLTAATVAPSTSHTSLNSSPSHVTRTPTGAAQPPRKAASNTKLKSVSNLSLSLLSPSEKKLPALATYDVGTLRLPHLLSSIGCRERAQSSLNVTCS